MEVFFFFFIGWLRLPFVEERGEHSKKMTLLDTSNERSADAEANNTLTAFFSVIRGECIDEEMQ